MMTRNDDDQGDDAEDDDKHHAEIVRNEIERRDKDQEKGKTMTERIMTVKMTEKKSESRMCLGSLTDIRI